MSDGNLFNPLDKRNLGKSVLDALLENPEEPLKKVVPFSGAGIYAIYYRGDFKPYAKLAASNRKGGSHPIYVGKAIPKGGRKGAATDVSLTSKALFSRLDQHAATIKTVKSLNIDHFTFRRLVVDDIWISLGESLVIERFQPIWNTVVEGFGNHDPGAGRYQGKRPLWDELHPGRAWAARCKPPKLNRTAIRAAVSGYMQRFPDGKQ
jgi:hypothetical protein